MMKFLLHCPLFVFVLIIYNVIIFTKPDLLLEPKIQPDAVAVVSEEAAADGNVTAEDLAAAEDFPAPVQKEVKGPKPVVSIPLISGAVWEPVVGDFLLLFAVLILYVELFKSTRTGVSSIFEHVLSMFVFIAFMIEFLVVEACGTSTFLIVTLLSLIDVIGGFTITISTARRDFGVGAHGGGIGE